MSLRIALLGLLSENPSSGYDLSRRFEEGISSYAWHAQGSQIYPELKRMLLDELVEITEEGPRGRKTYAITESGHRELREWMLQPPTPGGVRNEAVLRLFLLPALSAEEARGVLQGTIDAAGEHIRALEAVLADDPEADRVADRHGILAAHYGIRVYRATADWARWAMDRLPDEDPGIRRTGRDPSTS